jgi:hypothetical protein
LKFASHIYAAENVNDDVSENPLSITLPEINKKITHENMKNATLERDLFFNFKLTELTASNVLLKLGSSVENYTKNEIV